MNKPTHCLTIDFESQETWHFRLEQIEFQIGVERTIGIGTQTVSVTSQNVDSYWCALLTGSEVGVSRWMMKLGRVAKGRGIVICLNCDTNAATRFARKHSLA
jgi:hypothetical protein